MRRSALLVTAVWLALAMVAWASPGYGEPDPDRAGGHDPSRPRPGEAVPQPSLEQDASAQEGQERLRIDKDPDGSPYAAGELIVTYEERTPEAAEEAAVRRAGARAEKEYAWIDAELVSVPAVKKEKDRAQREEALAAKKRELERDPDVEAVDYNYVVEAQWEPNDAAYGEQWSVPKMHLPGAWDWNRGWSADGSSVKVAVLDTGVDANHPDLAGAVLAQKDFANGDAVADDVRGHGTHVAGTIGAFADNGIGIAGACPGCYILAGKVLNDQGAFDPAKGKAADLIEGLKWATDQGAQVVNMSLSLDENVSSLENAIMDAAGKGTMLVASAGNQSYALPRYPAAYGDVISVAATDDEDQKASYSNWGSTVDVAAPGGDLSSGRPGILSTVPETADCNGNGAADGLQYCEMQGTSMAAPHVAGLAALLIAEGYAPAEARRRIEGSAFDLGDAGRDDSFGYGRVNAEGAVPSWYGTPDRIFGVYPVVGGAGTVADLKVEGTTLREGTQLTLLREGDHATSYEASGEVVESPTRMSASVALPSSAPVGRYDVHVKNPDGAGSMLEGGFRVGGVKTAIPYLDTGYKYKVYTDFVDSEPGFQKPDFDDSGFSTGAAGFGSSGYDGMCTQSPLKVNTNWPGEPGGAFLLLRKNFNLPAGATNVKVSVAIDNNVQVWLNGQDISGGWKWSDNCAIHDRYTFTAPKSVLTEGANTLAVQARDMGGPAYADVKVTYIDAEDTTKPTISLTSPASGATVSGTSVALKAEASDDTGVADVRFYVYKDGAWSWVGTDTTAGGTSGKEYSFSWDSTTVSDGPNYFYADARDAAGNGTYTEYNTITVENTAEDTTAPMVKSLVATSRTSTGVPLRKTNFKATFNEEMKTTTLSKATYKLYKCPTTTSTNCTTQITNVTVTPSTDGLSAILNPYGGTATVLAANTRYKVVVTTGAKDVAGNALVQQKESYFKTGSR